MFINNVSVAVSTVCKCYLEMQLMLALGNVEV